MRDEELTHEQERDLQGGHGQIRSSLPETFPREALGEKPIDNARLAAIRERLSKTTPGPWTAEPNYETDCDENPFRFGSWVCGAEDGVQVSERVESIADAEFIAHAPDDIAYLLSLLGVK